MEADMSSTGDISLNGNGPVVLEGTLLKRSSHHYWNERHFVFSADNTLSYFHNKNSDHARRSYSISREAGCEVSNLFVSQRPHNSGKEMIYCFKVTWGNDSEASATNASNLNESFVNRHDDASSVGTDNRRPSLLGSPGQNFDNPENNLDDDIDYLFESDGAEEPESCSSPVLSATPGKGLPLIDQKTNKMSGDRSVDSDGILITSSSGNRVSNNNHNSMSNLSTVKKKKKKSYFPKPFKNIARVSSQGSKKPSKKERPEDDLIPPVEEEISMAFSASGDNNNLDGSIRRTDRVQRMYAEQKMKERDKLRQQYLSQKKQQKKKQQKMIMHGTKVAVAASAAAGVAILTAGVGIVAGLAFVGIGAAAGASSGTSAALGLSKRKRSEIIIATASYEDAKLWKSTLDAHLEYENLKETTWGRILFENGQANGAFLSRELGSGASSDDLNDRKIGGETKPFLFEPSTQWRPLDGWALSLLGTGNQGLRIFREEKNGEQPEFHGFQNQPVQKIFTNLSVDGGSCSPLKAHVVLNTSPLDAFMCIMSYARMMPNGSDTGFCPQSEQASSFRVVEKIDDHMDVVHLVFRPIYLFPSWTYPRDFVLVRYWRFEPDGSFVICYESVTHRDCPPIDGYVRGDMHQAFTISPSKQAQTRKMGTKMDNRPQECLLTAVVQVDPKGWVPISNLPFVSVRSYGEAFGVSALAALLDIRDAIDRDRFLTVALDVEPPTNHFPRINDLPENESGEPSSSRSGRELNYDFSYVSREALKVQDSPTGLYTTPPPFALDKWAEPDANSFLVRGPTYKNDGMKINAGASIARLFAVDIVEVTLPLYDTGMTKHPTQRVQQALRKEKQLKAKGLQSDVPPFIFALNIVIPGEPLYHAVFYYAIDDLSEIDGTSGTPTSKLCNEFFFGDSDQFRDNTFKLIPQIVQGNFMVRKAVGSTPAIMGKKLRQLYVKDENKRFFEIVLDCGSSSVAAGVIRLSLGYAKTLVVDLGFLFEGDSPEVLPERIFGSVRLKNPDFSKVRKVGQPN